MARHGKQWDKERKARRKARRKASQYSSTWPVNPDNLHFQRPRRPPRGTRFPSIGHSRRMLMQIRCPPARAGLSPAPDRADSPQTPLTDAAVVRPGLPTQPIAQNGGHDCLSGRDLLRSLVGRGPGLGCRSVLVPSKGRVSADIMRRGSVAPLLPAPRPCRR